MKAFGVPGWHNLSVRHKLLVVIVVVILLPAGVTIFLCDRMMQEVSTEQVQDSMRLDALVLVSSFQKTIERSALRIHAYGALISGPHCHAEDDLTTSHLQNYISHHAKNFLNNNEDVDSISIRTISGSALLAESQEGAEVFAPHEQALRGAWDGKIVFAGPFVSGALSDAYVEIGTPVIGSSGEVIAMVVGRIRLDAVLPSMHLPNGCREKSRRMLLDANGVLIWDSEPDTYIMKPAQTLSQDQLEQILDIRQFGPASNNLMATTFAIPGFTGNKKFSNSDGFFSTGTSDEPGRGFVHSFDLYGSTWTLLYVLPDSVLYADLSRASLMILYVSVGVAFGSLLLGISLSRTIVKPVSMISRSLDRFSKGEDATFEYERKDEFGVLAGSFNQMVVSVKSFQLEVEQQNRDLAEANRKMRLLNAGLEETVRERTQDIEKEKEKLNAVVSCASVALSTLDKQSNVTWSNSIVGEAFPGMDRLRASAKLTSETGTPCRWPVHQVLQDGKMHTETIQIDTQENNGWWQVTGVPMLDAEGEIEGVLEMVQDVTEQKLTAQRVVHAEKMSSVGYLASGIAHEFNNIMCAILGHANLAKANPGQLERFIDVVVRQCDRASKITQALVSMSRRKESVMKNSDLVTLTDEVVRLMENEVSKEQIELVRSYPKEAVTLVNESHFQQVVLSLLINARQAIGKNGKVEIRIDTDGQMIILSIADDGCGIKPEHLSKVFEPFFTTKGALGGGKKQEGTGLGLSTVYNIITNMGGEVHIDSAVGEGTTVSCSLPIREEQRNTYIPVEAERRVPDATSRPYKVLVVDDEEELRELLRIVLTLEKNDVVEACNAEQALDLAVKSDFDVIFMDINMPGAIDTWTALEEIKRTRPRTKVILVSGSAIEADEGGSLGDADAFIRKPFDNEQIGAVLAKVTSA